MHDRRFCDKKRTIITVVPIGNFTTGTKYEYSALTPVIASVFLPTEAIRKKVLEKSCTVRIASSLRSSQ